MRRNTVKRAAANRQADKVRREFAELFPWCWCCGRYGVQVHEIPRGPHRAQAMHHREALLSLCEACHREVGDLGAWPIARQAALKLVRDPEYFDPELLCVLRSRPATDCTLQDVVQFLAVVPG